MFLRFLQFLKTEMTQAVELLHGGGQGPVAADVLVTQGARASIAMVLKWFAQNILTLAPKGLILLAPTHPYDFFILPTTIIVDSYTTGREYRRE